jgi:hypothetical protein
VAKREQRGGPLGVEWPARPFASEFLKTSSYSSQNERSGHKLTAKSASDGAKAERRYISVVDNLKSVQSGACTREHLGEESPHPVSLAPVYIRLTATSQLTSYHSLTLYSMSRTSIPQPFELQQHHSHDFLSPHLNLLVQR